MSQPRSLFEKVWDSHSVRTLSNGQTQLLIGTHLIHEVTSPQAFGMLRDLDLKVKFPNRTFATVDHIVPTTAHVEPFSDPLAQEMINALRDNCKEFGVKFFDIGSGTQGVVHVVGPEQGITQPGTTIACGDSHTATHGAFGAIAFGIGTTQIRDVLATQTMIDAADIAPSVTWGISPDHGIFVTENIPDPAAAKDEDTRESIREALEYMKLPAGAPIAGTKVDVCFIGSCTNGRLSDFREAAKFLKGHTVDSSVKAIAVPGSEIVNHLCEEEGIAQIFRDAGFEWREAGCSMCLAMNPDKLEGDQLCASSSNRNFKGRQGSPTGRTVLMSPVMVAAAAVTGVVSDARDVFGLAEKAA
ncbi:UNVERIFIED_CONTAM: hypothetical protein GTU68_059687 [Idotea baltica]|nr:hypothetical protein [Idotea baltica]